MPARRRTALAKRYTGAKLAPGKARVQVLLFPRSDWSLDDARVWAALHGFNADTFDRTATYIRIHPRGETESRAMRVRTIPYGVGGLRAVVEWR